jgi:hypothetical protein
LRARPPFSDDVPTARARAIIAAQAWAAACREVFPEPSGMDDDLKVTELDLVNHPLAQRGSRRTRRAAAPLTSWRACGQAPEPAVDALLAQRK